MVNLAEQGLAHFPDSPLLRLYRGMGYFHQGRFDRALACLEPLTANPEIPRLVAACHQALGDRQSAAKYRRMRQHWRDLKPLQSMIFRAEDTLQKPIA